MSQITLTFDSEQDKVEFLNQLVDGWGDGNVIVNWDTETDIVDAEEIHVTPLGDYS